LLFRGKVNQPSAVTGKGGEKGRGVKQNSAPVREGGRGKKEKNGLFRMCWSKKTASVPQKEEGKKERETAIFEPIQREGKKGGELRS